MCGMLYWCDIPLDILFQQATSLFSNNCKDYISSGELDCLVWIIKLWKLSAMVLTIQSKANIDKGIKVIGINKKKKKTFMCVLWSWGYGK